jgi:hypothetical protein
MEKEKFRFRYFREAVLQVIKDLNGEASLQEIYEKIPKHWKFSPYQMEFVRKWGMERYKHSVRCTLQGLKKQGLIENPIRGVWVLTGKAPTIHKEIPTSAQRKISIKKHSENKLFTLFLNEIRNIHSFIKGAHNIGNEKLMFLVWFCYNFGLYQEGTSIFTKIDKNTISDEMYKIAEKISRACEEKLL